MFARYQFYAYDDYNLIPRETLLMRPANNRIVVLLSAASLLGTSLPAQAALVDIPLVGNFLAWGAELVGFPTQPARPVMAPARQAAPAQAAAPARIAPVRTPPPADWSAAYPSFDETPNFAGNPGDSGFGHIVSPPPRAVKGVSPENGGTDPLRWPVTTRAGGGNTVISAYGERWLNGGTKPNDHKGIDLNVPSGTPVMSPFAGKVLTVSPACRNPNSSATRGGCEVAILRDDGVMASYAHLSGVDVKPGQRVSSGATVARSGKAGSRSEGAHLHMSTCRISPSTRQGTMPAAACSAPGSQRIDPVTLMDKNDPRYREAQLLKGYQQQRIACHRAAKGNAKKEAACEATWRGQSDRVKAMAKNRNVRKYEIARGVPLSVLQGCAAEARTGRIKYDDCLSRNGHN